MIAYILNSILSLLALYLIYKLLLANQKTYRFNRFYLLVAIVVGLSFPALDQLDAEHHFIYRPGDEIIGMEAETITAVKKAPSIFVTGKVFPESDIKGITPEQSSDSPEFSWGFLLFSFYFLVTLFLLSRFIYGIYSIYARMKGLEYIDLGTTKIRLAESRVAPHSFMDAIFVNKQDYENGLISDEILKHEMAHIKGKHTLDVLFVELVKVFFWFNPAVYLFSRAIQINHEYLADDNVLKQYQDITDYQQQLLKATKNHSKVTFASNLNFYLTKKRLLMMTKSDSLVLNSLKIALLTPLIPLMILLFNTRVVDKENLLGTYETELVPDTVMVDKNFSYVQWKTTDGNLYTGSNKLFDPKTGILQRETIYENGNTIAHKSYNGIGNVFFRTLFDYDEGIPVRKTVYMSGDLMSEFIYPTPENNYIGIQRYWHLGDGLQYEAHFLNQPDNFHGLVTEFDENGEVVEQERYKNGELVEKIK